MKQLGMTARYRAPGWARRLLVAAVAATALVVCGSLAPRALRASTGNVHVVRHQVVSLGGNTSILALSPNGQWLAAEQSNGGKAAPQLCIYAAASLARQRCTAEPNGSLYRPSLAWSPDSTRLTWTENWVQYFEDSDIWVWNVAGGKPTDLTDDGVTGSLVGGHLHRNHPGATALVDAAPAWSADSRSLYFARSPLKGHTTALYRISASGGTPRRLLTIAANQEDVLFYGLRVAGTRILYTVDYPNPHDPHNGLWIANQDGSNPHMLVPADKRKGPPFVTDVTPDGATALVYYYAAATSYTNLLNTSFYALVDVRTGKVQPIDPAVGPHAKFFSPTGATLSPDGARLLYTYRTFELQWRIAVRDLHGGPEQLLTFAGDQQEPFFGYTDLGVGLNWAGNNTVYVASLPDRGVLLHLGM